MQRIRSVKPELFKHEGLFECEIETGAPVRTAFVALFTVADREGRFKWRPRALKLDCLPYDECDFSRVLDALATRGFIRKYVCEGVEYGVICNFSEHQVINNRESASRIPEPANYIDIKADATRASRVPDACPTPLVHAQGEGKGREGKGREGNTYTSGYSPNMADVGLVFDYWRSVMKKGEQTKLTPKRKKAVASRLKDGYSVETLKRAIDGCSRSDHHMGKTSGTVYNDLELICRSGEKVEQFSENIGRVKPSSVNGAETIEGFQERASSQAQRIRESGILGMLNAPQSDESVVGDGQ